MPFATATDGARLWWREDGRIGGQPLLLLNSLGTDLHMWDAVVPLLAERFRVIRTDTRGHGASGVTPGDYAIPELARDAAAVLDAADVERAHVAGISMGGMVALRLALDTGRALSVAACNTSAEVPSDPWLQRAELVRREGLGAIADATMSRFFSEPYRQRRPWRLETARRTLLSLDPMGYAACCVAIGRLDLMRDLARLDVPVLVVNGGLDEATPPAAHGERIVAAIPGARGVTLETGHLSAIEDPDGFAGALSAAIGR